MEGACELKTIIDVSSVVYSGHHGRPGMRFQGFPVGGIYALLRIIASELTRSDMVLCFDGGNILKKELLPTYKAGRVPDYSVAAQIDVLKELLTGCDIPFYHDPKYEADDLVYSVCASLLEMGETELVQIMSDDHDLACNVRRDCSIKPVSKNGCCIDIDNYAERVVRGKYVPYNTILMWKIFHGDSSDHYSGIKIPGLDYESVADHFMESVEPLIGPQGFNESAYADYDVFEAFISEYSDRISAEDMEKLKAQARIAYPYKVDVYTQGREALVADWHNFSFLEQAERKHMKFFGEGSFDAKRFDFLVSMIGPRAGYRRRFNVYREDGSEGEEVRQYFALQAKNLSSGVLAVERYRSKKAEIPQIEPLHNMSLPL